MMNIEPLPLEKELRIEAIKRRIDEMSREELVENLASAIDLLTRMTHQTKQLVAYIEIMEEKLGWVDNDADSAGNSTN
jgi:tRNA A37 N6-isopentenylltransferase MiaA